MEIPPFCAQFCMQNLHFDGQGFVPLLQGAVRLLVCIEEVIRERR